MLFKFVLRSLKVLSFTKHFVVCYIIFQKKSEISPREKGIFILYTEHMVNTVKKWRISYPITSDPLTLNLKTNQ